MFSSKSVFILIYDFCYTRTMMVLLRSSVGRASELATTTWDSCEFEIDGQCLIFDWRELKTGHETPIHLSCDAKDWILL